MNRCLGLFPAPPAPASSRRGLGAAVVAMFFLSVLPIGARAAEFSLEQDEQGITVNLDGKLFTRYLIKSGAKPILFPVVGPTGKEVTRGYPMRKAIPGEREDHQHHRSFWFTHGDVNGVSFWHETEGHGNIVHREFLRSEAKDGRAVIASSNDWLGPDGKKICEDQRTLTFGADGDARWIDFDITLKATEGKVKFGDTKEGSFGVRVAGTMKTDQPKGMTGGKIVTSEGLVDRQAWGTAAAWVDYSGPVDGETVGLAILNHPSSFRYPTYWHVRTYGLFAANPFGLHDFKGSKEIDGSYTLNRGEHFTLRYRVLLHPGDAEQGRVAEHFRKYAETK